MYIIICDLIKQLAVTGALNEGMIPFSHYGLLITRTLYYSLVGCFYVSSCLHVVMVVTVVTSYLVMVVTVVTSCLVMVVTVVTTVVVYM